jgi:hypothetical protein
MLYRATFGASKIDFGHRQNGFWSPDRPGPMLYRAAFRFSLGGPFLKDLKGFGFIFKGNVPSAWEI